ncbi:plasma-membrane choline transporter-domain-containing protein [Pisolithus tinctorius]|nr:plasma-membrane choline transporter-domain-containing protein [Pisolithus tinctorius]KAI6139044.1 plasma-membrane choline transporter-domain-containing protein [Pisolithus tinctorius]
MAKSFAQYASEFLMQQHPESSLSSSQPLFFSFTTDDEGSRNGNDNDHDVADLDDPHLRDSRASRVSRRGIGSSSGGGRSGTGKVRADMDEEEDPYLRLDQDEDGDEMPPGASRHAAQSARLLASNYGQAESQDFPKGWLAHQASPPRRAPRSPSPSPSPSSRSSLDSPGSLAMLGQPSTPRHKRLQTPPPPPPRQSREPLSLSLTQSLLPRDGTTRPLDVFSLPDPKRSLPRRKFNDSTWTIVWCTGVSICLFFSVLLLFLGRKPGKSRGPVPYITLLHTVPLLTILTFLSAAVAYLHIFLLRIFVRPVMVATSVFIPATLFISAIWAFAGSFMWDGDQEPTWGETVGLRLFSLIPLVLSFLTARRLVDLPREIHSTSSILDLASQLLIANPFLLALSPAILLLTLFASIPFLTLIFRLVLIGYIEDSSGGTVEGHLREWADWAIVGAVCVWLWSWGVARGILRTTSAGVIGAWYYADPEQPPPLSTDTHIIHAALFRATYPSLGSIVLGALILAGIRVLSLLTLALRLLPSYFPIVLRPWLQPISVGVGMAVAYLESVTSSLSRYALIYAGLTGDPFFPSARRARALTIAVETSNAGRYRRKFKTEPQLTMLTYAPLTMTFPFALLTYLFVAHTLNAPDSALGSAMLAGGVTALVGLYCVGLVKDTADVLYMCYCIDKDVGLRRREDVFAAFEYDLQPRAQQQCVVQPAVATPRVSTPSSHIRPVGAVRAPHATLVTTTTPPAPTTEQVRPPSSPPTRYKSPPRQPPLSRAVLLDVPPEPIRPLPPATPETDVNPFEHEPLDFEDSGRRSNVMPYSLSLDAEAEDVSSVDDEFEGRGHESSQLLPGSGIF